MLCPIANWKKQSPNALAFDALTYEELDLLIQRYSQYLSQISHPLLSFAPQKRAEDVALFFAAWRLGKAIYPVNFRLPSDAIDIRLKKTKAHWVDISAIPHCQPLEKTKLGPTKLATLLETSSAKKIACHLLEAHLISAKHAADALKIASSSVYCLNLPLFHVSGIASFLRAFLMGGQVVSSEKMESATHVSMVPTQLYRHMQSQTLPQKLQCLLIGGAPIPPNLISLAL